MPSADEIEEEPKEKVEPEENGFYLQLLFRNEVYFKIKFAEKFLKLFFEYKKVASKLYLNRLNSYEINFNNFLKVKLKT